MRKLLLDIAWCLFPERLGLIIKYISGGWVFQKVYQLGKDRESLDVVAYGLINVGDEELRHVTLWEK